MKRQKNQRADLNNIGSVKTVYAIDPEDTILSADCTLLVNPTIEHLADQLLNGLSQHRHILVPHPSAEGKRMNKRYEKV